MRASAGDTVILGDSLVKRSGDIEEPSGAKLGGPGTLAFPNAAGEKCKVIKEGKEVFAKAPERFNHARKNRPALCARIPGFLIKLTEIRGAAGLGKGTLRVPLGQRVSD